MKTIYLAIFLTCSSFIFLSTPGFSNDRMPLPSAIKNLNKQNPELLQLKKLLDNGQTILFYQAADKMLKEAKRYRKKDVTPQELTDGLFLCYLIASAPFIDVNQHSNVVWLMNYTNLDYKVKDTMSRSIPFIALTDKNTTLSGKDEALRFYLTAKSQVLKQFRNNIDYAFPATWIYSEMLIDHAPQFTNDLEATAEFANKLVTNEARNNELLYFVHNHESRLIKELMQCFPTKAVEVKKYLHMAGYSDKEIPALLDRTVGRVPKAEYLYKGLPKKRN